MGHILGTCARWSRLSFCTFGALLLTPSLQGQYVDGLRAPLLLHPPTEVYSYDEEFTVILGDWYHTEHSVLLQQYVSRGNPIELFFVL
jgi:FtsP/CotA-like multicopper oxidase with cupredoxin domain